MKKVKQIVKQNAIFSGAGDGTRTRDNLLGSSSERFSAFYAQFEAGT